MDAEAPAAGQPADLDSRKSVSLRDTELLQFSTRRCCGAMTFHYRLTEPAGHQLISDHQNGFETDFHHEAARLEQWAGDRRWPAPPIPNLHVAVSDEFNISRALVPAWNGRAGHIEFPWWRVVGRKAAIVHELVHVFFPSGNRFLAEGLAVYLQAEIGGNPAFPNFGRPLHELVRERLQEMIPEFSLGHSDGLAQLHLADLDAIATPSPLELKVGKDFYGEEPRGQSRIYPIAGSFVQFLIETRGLEKFRALYELTPLVPHEQAAGSPGRWFDVYRLSLEALSDEWKSQIARCNPESVNRDPTGDCSRNAAFG